MFVYIETAYIYICRSLTSIAKLAALATRGNLFVNISFWFYWSVVSSFL